MIGLFTMYWYSQRNGTVVDTAPANLPRSIPIEVDDPAALEQNGRPLTNDGGTQGNQSLQQTRQSPQSSESNLQGSPSTQSTQPPVLTGPYEIVP